MLNKKNLFVCLLYGIISTSQTLNSRYLFRTIGFNFYSFSFFTQRIVNLIIARIIWKTTFRKEDVLTIIPYTILMCTTNILSSYCVTVLPLAAFMAFKKFIVFFVLIIAIIMKFDHNFSTYQYVCIFFIVVGGVLVGEQDILNGESIGYIVALFYNICEASTLEYQSYMRREKNFEPSGVFFMNSCLSLPYYLALMTVQSEFDEIYYFFTTNVTIKFVMSFALLLILAGTSEFTASYIAMNISPFEKATVSNIKDIVLTFISVYIFKDFLLSYISEIGILLCLSASIIFSYTLLTKEAHQATSMVETQSIAIEPEEINLSNIEEMIDKELAEQEEIE